MPTDFNGRSSTLELECYISQMSYAEKCDQRLNAPLVEQSATTRKTRPARVSLIVGQNSTSIWLRVETRAVFHSNESCVSRAVYAHTYTHTHACTHTHTHTHTHTRHAQCTLHHNPLPLTLNNSPLLATGWSGQ